MMEPEATLTRAGWRAPRAGAVAGIVFAVLLVTSLALIRSSVPHEPRDAGAWLSGNWQTVNLALNLLPFAGIAFLWFIGVLRDRMGASEDRFFATVFLGSGLLFLAMMFTAAALAGGLIMLYGAAPGRLPDAGLYAFGRLAAYHVVNVYALKMAGVFMITTCTLAIRLGLFPRWIAVLGYALALLLLLSVGYLYWAPLVFPLWVLLVSVWILFSNLRPAPLTDGRSAPGNAPGGVDRA
ncbi:MAG: hypothetical protein KA419_19865 [Acidobacteria bacterium]|nr:hypothetical protein [Acidobacteriota bacterium]